MSFDFFKTKITSFCTLGLLCRECICFHIGKLNILNICLVIIITINYFLMYFVFYQAICIWQIPIRRSQYRFIHPSPISYHSLITMEDASCVISSTWTIDNGPNFLFTPYWSKQIISWHSSLLSIHPCLKREMQRSSYWRSHYVSLISLISISYILNLKAM